MKPQDSQNDKYHPKRLYLVQDVRDPTDVGAAC
jgi:hypothetical protein